MLFQSVITRFRLVYMDSTPSGLVKLPKQDFYLGAFLVLN
jgi:hypothetical protein